MRWSFSASAFSARLVRVVHSVTTRSEPRKLCTLAAARVQLRYDNGARRHRMSVSQLVSAIENQQRQGINISSAIRLYVLDHYRRLA
jgi:hypothetical protein